MLGGVMNATKGPQAPEPPPLQPGGSVGAPPPTALTDEQSRQAAKGLRASEGITFTDIGLGGPVAPAATAAPEPVLGTSPGSVPPSAFTESGTLATPPSYGRPAALSSSERVRDVNPAPAAASLTPPKDDTRLRDALNIANSTAQGLRGLYQDMSRGPGGSPLMAPRAPGPAYTPTARRGALRLSDILGRR